MHSLSTFFHWHPEARTLLLCVCCAGLLTACGDSDEDNLSPERIQALTQQAVLENHQIIVSAGELMNVKTTAFTSEGIDVSSSYRSRLATSGGCTPVIEDVYVTDETHYDTLIYGGTVTIDYKNGVSCFGSTDMRKGKVIISFTYIVSFLGDTTYATKETIRFVDFVRDSVTINGTVQSQSSSNKPTSLKADYVQITYPDNTTATWHGELLYETQPATGDILVRGGVDGLTRSGLYYTASITSDLNFPSSCRMGAPTTGMIDVKVNQALATVDYGRGQCDKTYALTGFKQVP